MLFRVGPANRITRLVAALIVAALGAPLIVPAPPLGLSLFGIGMIAAIVQGIAMWRERRDPYDLSRLWETAPIKAEPEEDDKERTMALCHRCGASMSAKHSICPQCGVPLGQ
jgi:uncharacterized iron-regulated membrane protein